MTPKMKGVAAALSTLRHNIETQAQAVLDQTAKLNDRATAAIATAKTNLADTEAAVVEIEQLNASLEGSNGGPTSAGSQPASAPQTPPSGNGPDPQPQPQASWAKTA